MYKELHFYIFIRNSVVLCLFFSIISTTIIEKGKIERGENSYISSVFKKNKPIVFSGNNSAIKPISINDDATHNTASVIGSSYDLLNFTRTNAFELSQNKPYKISQTVDL